MKTCATQIYFMDFPPPPEKKKKKKNVEKKNPLRNQGNVQIRHAWK